MFIFGGFFDSFCFGSSVSLFFFCSSSGNFIYFIFILSWLSEENASVGQKDEKKSFCVFLVSLFRLCVVLLFCVFMKKFYLHFFNTPFASTTSVSLIQLENNLKKHILLNTFIIHVSVSAKECVLQTFISASPSPPPRRRFLHKSARYFVVAIINFFCSPCSFFQSLLFLSFFLTFFMLFSIVVVVV